MGRPVRLLLRMLLGSSVAGLRAPGILVVSALIMLSQLASADHCTTYSTSSTNVPEGGMIVVPIALGIVPNVFYAVNDICQPSCVFSIWVYEESNGLPGLQRADDIAVDTCHDMFLPDTLVF